MKIVLIISKEISSIINIPELRIKKDLIEKKREIFLLIILDFMF